MLSLSVVIPTYNRLGQLKQVIAGLETQEYPLNKFEVLVISDGSSDGTNEYLETAITSLNLRPILQTNAGAASARNHGIEEAAGELILFLDDDVVPTTNLITEHLQSHTKHGDKVVVLGPMLTPPDFTMKPWVQWEQAMLVKQYEAMLRGDWEPTARQFFTGNSSLRRKHLLVNGGFDIQFKRAEDLELAYRLSDQGLHFKFNAEAVGYHFAERSFASWMSIPYAYGVNDVIFSLEKGQDWLLPVIWREYFKRNLLIRSLTRLCLDRPFFSKPALKVLEKTAWAGHTSGTGKLAHLACSGMFNLRYYQGVTEQLGGRKVFFDGLNRTRASNYLPSKDRTNVMPSHS